MAAEQTRGTLPGCWEGTPKKVLWATIEASHEKEVKPRLMANGADMSLIEFVTVNHNGGARGSRHIRIFNPKFLDEMHEKVRRDNVGMIVLDPMLDVLARVDLKDQQQIRDAIGVINAFAEEEDILVLGIAHFNKMTSVDTAIDRITGSAAFSQRPRAVVAFAYDAENDQHVITQVKNNWGETHTLPSLSFSVEVVRTGPRKVRTIKLEWEIDSEFTVNDILGRRNQEKGSPTEDAACAWLETKLRFGAVERGVLQHETKSDGISWAAVLRAYRALGVVSEKVQVEEGAERRAGRPPVAWKLPPTRLRRVKLPRHCYMKRNDITTTIYSFVSYNSVGARTPAAAARPPAAISSRSRPRPRAGARGRPSVALRSRPTRTRKQQTRLF